MFKMKKKILKKWNLDALAKEFEVLDREQNRSTVAGTYYFDSCAGTFLGSAGTGDDVRFIHMEDWGVIRLNNTSGAGYLFSNTSVSFLAKSNAIKSMLPASAQNISIGNTDQRTAYFNNDGNFFFDPNNTSFNNFYNLTSVMYHESYHWNSGHVQGTSNYSGYSGVKEIQTIMAQINHPDYSKTTDAFKKETAGYLYGLWRDDLQGQPGYTRNDAYRIAKVTGY
jgi:hypothetical protein